MSKKPFTLTYILYDDDDGIYGWIMALMSLAPVFFVCIVCSSILLHRDMHSVFLLIGLLSCTLLNQILKRIIKQERPMQGGVQISYGMPSDHSQFMSCLCIYLTLCLQWTYPVQRTIAIIILWITWSLVIGSRLYLGEHSLAQVIVGIIVGLLYGLFWYIVNKKVFRNYYETICQTSLFQWFQFKDYTNVPNVFEKELEMAETYNRVCNKED